MEPSLDENPAGQRNNMLFSKILRLRVIALVLLIFALSAIYYLIFLVYGSNSELDATVDKVILDLPYDASKNNKRKGVYVDVYYESLCPDSRSFFVNELLPTVHKLGDFLSVNLIPYGRAETIINGDSIEFKCQHGHQECLGNKFHACVIQNTLGDNQLAVNVTGCLFEDYFQPPAERCCRKYGVPWESVKSCAYGLEGSQLLKKYGDKTNRLLPIDFIPTVALNQVTGSKSYQAAILKNLSNEVCRILERYNEIHSSMLVIVPELDKFKRLPLVKLLVSETKQTDDYRGLYTSYLGGMVRAGILVLGLPEGSGETAEEPDLNMTNPNFLTLSLSYVV